ncbi:MAG: hypothetical protein E6F94_11845 [Actinobacteria bacterium]|nr:MAG: hypothetical protein E6F94_11845 [Actinomycetota bacterium]
MKKIVLILVVAAAVAFPAAAGAASFSGIVVAKQVRRHALVVASPTGAVHVVRTHHLATRLGARVTVRAHRLRDGTFSATKVSVRGRARRARIHGVVVRRLRGRVLIAAGHSVLSIRSHQLFSLQDDNPGAQPGDEVDETVTIDNGNLDEDQVEEVGHTQKLELEGAVVSVTSPTNAADGEIVLQVGTSTIHVVVPAGTQLPALAAGDNVELKVTLSGTTFTLAKADEEDDSQGDDDQGDDDGGGGDD